MLIFQNLAEISGNSDSPGNPEGIPRDSPGNPGGFPRESRGIPSGIPGDSRGQAHCRAFLGWVFEPATLSGFFAADDRHFVGVIFDRISFRKATVGMGESRKEQAVNGQRL